MINSFKYSIFSLLLSCILSSFMSQNYNSYPPALDKGNMCKSIKVKTSGWYVYSKKTERDKRIFYEMIKLDTNGKAYTMTLLVNRISNEAIRNETAGVWQYSLDSSSLILKSERDYKCIHITSWDYYRIKGNRIKEYMSITDYQMTRKVYTGKNLNRRTYRYIDTLTAMPKK